MNKEEKKKQDHKDYKELEEKLDTLKQELEETQKTADTYMDQFMRSRAEFENYRKRIQKQAVDNLKIGEKNLARDIVVVLDNLQRALDHKDIDYEGLELIKKEFYNILSSKGLKQMESEGKKFDHNFHHAVGFCEVDDEDQDENIVEVLQQGFMWNEEVLRPAMVIVAKKKEISEEEDKEGNE